MSAASTESLAIRLEFGTAPGRDANVAGAIAEILTRPCFAALGRLCGRRKDRWSRHTSPTPELIAAYLRDSSHHAISLDSKRARELIAAAEVDNGLGLSHAPAAETRFGAYVVVPYEAGTVDACIAGACDLARAVGAAAGFLALEPRFGLAHRLAVGGSRPMERPGLSTQRFRERRGRVHHDERLASELAGVEWGTFLGPGHVARIDLDAVRMSGAFHRVVEVTPERVYLQVTATPTDDLTDAFESKLEAARRVLAPLLIDVSSMSLE